MLGIAADAAYAAYIMMTSRQLATEDARQLLITPSRKFYIYWHLAQETIIEFFRTELCAG